VPSQRTWSIPSRTVRSRNRGASAPDPAIATRTTSGPTIRAASISVSSRCAIPTVPAYSTRNGPGRGATGPTRPLDAATTGGIRRTRPRAAGCSSSARARPTAGAVMTVARE